LIKNVVLQSAAQGSYQTIGAKRWN